MRCLCYTGVLFIALFHLGVPKVSDKGENLIHSQGGGALADQPPQNKLNDPAPYQAENKLVQAKVHIPDPPFENNQRTHHIVVEVQPPQQPVNVGNEPPQQRLNVGNQQQPPEQHVDVLNQHQPQQPVHVAYQQVTTTLRPNFDARDLHVVKPIPIDRNIEHNVKVRDDRNVEQSDSAMRDKVAAQFNRKMVEPEMRNIDENKHVNQNYLQPLKPQQDEEKQRQYDTGQKDIDAKKPGVAVADAIPSIRPADTANSEQRATEVKVPERILQNPSELDRIAFDYDQWFILTAGFSQSFKIRRSEYPQPGSPWPLPQRYKTDPGAVFSVSENLVMSPSTYDCALLRTAFTRFSRRIFSSQSYSFNVNKDWLLRNTMGDISNLHVKVRNECKGASPTLQMDESYELEVSSQGSARVSANQVWGALRGLQTFSQLVYKISHNQYRVNWTIIYDFPRFKHRGVMVETSRNYLSVNTILQNLDLMEMNKFNVLHWHMVDDQSFPFKSEILPNLTLGAYNKDTMIYTYNDVKRVVEQARLRGIRVIPEFDTPGHTYSWRFVDDNLLTKCYTGDGVPNGDLGPLNPINKLTFQVLEKLFGELLRIFPDSYFHAGGDEVGTECWLSNPAIKQYFNLSTPSKNDFNYDSTDSRPIVLHYFNKLSKVFLNISKQQGGRDINYIVWQEVWDQMVSLNPNKSVVHVWKDQAQYLHFLLTQGYKALFSTCWYLNYINYGVDWHKFYQCDPISELKQFDDTWKTVKPYIHNLLGGEACLWSEYIDDNNFFQTLWPRASAVAERLWSRMDVTNVSLAAPRIEEQRCRMLGLGFPVSVLSGPSYCQIARRPAVIASNFQVDMPQQLPYDFKYVGLIALFVVLLLFASFFVKDRNRYRSQLTLGRTPVKSVVQITLVVTVLCLLYLVGSYLF